MDFTSPPDGPAGRGKDRKIIRNIAFSVLKYRNPAIAISFLRPHGSHCVSPRFRLIRSSRPLDKLGVTALLSCRAEGSWPRSRNISTERNIHRWGS